MIKEKPLEVVYWFDSFGENRYQRLFLHEHPVMGRRCNTKTTRLVFNANTLEEARLFWKQITSEELEHEKLYRTLFYPHPITPVEEAIFGLNTRIPCEGCTDVLYLSNDIQEYH